MAEHVQHVLTEISHAPNGRDKRPYTLLVTDERLVFAQVTPHVSRETGKLLQASNQGKGFFARWKNQIAGPDFVEQYYRGISPDQALQDAAENFSVPHAAVRALTITYYSDGEGDSGFYFDCQTDERLIKFSTPRNYEKAFEQTYGSRVAKRAST